MEHGEVHLYVAMRHVLRFMVNSKMKNDMEAEFLRTSIKGLSLCGDEELVDDSYFYLVG
jgi:hypothetical protein